MRPKHSIFTRIFHWANVPILAIMIWSGLLIYWANDVYEIKLFGKVWFHFFPDSVYAFLHIPFRLAEGMAWHFAVMWLFFLNGLVYFLYTLFSGAWRELTPNWKSFKEAGWVVLHDLHLTKRIPPQRKFNAAQQIAYTGVIAMGLGSIITGLAIYKPVQLKFFTFICGGYEWARAEHFILTIGYVLFFIIHIAQVVKTGWNNFQSMVTGYEKTTKDKVD